MSYQEQLNPWVVHKLMPDFKQAAVARFRHRSDAEAYLKIVTRMVPQSRFAIAFDVQQKISSTPKPAPEAVA